VISVPPDIRRALREHVRRAAKNLPGTYRMVAADGEVLYVGKSKRIRTRLLSYFRARKGEKGRRILEHACRVEWDYEPSEFAALLGELRLIKKLRPRFNVQHKRDGRYSFLKLTGGAAPRLLVTRAVSDDSATYFGPFRGGRRIEEAVRELNDVLGLRDCALGTPIFFADQQDLFSIERAPRCHRLELRRCIGPCAGRCSRAGYLRRVELARSFLDGNADEPIRWLCERMQLAVDRWDFEHAASIRDRIRRLELLRDEFGRLRDALDSLSFLYPVAGAQGDDRVYLIRRGTVRAALPAPRDEAGTRELERISREQFGAPEASSALVTRHQVDEILLLSRWFRLHPRERDRAFPPMFGEHSGTTSGHAIAAPTG
jgi:excinuclease ABC subunit C